MKKLVLLLLLFLLLMEAVHSMATEDPFLLADRHRMMLTAVAGLLVTFPFEFGMMNNPMNILQLLDYNRAQGPARSRTRRSVGSMFSELGPYYVRRAHRMDEESFWNLHRLLRPCLQKKRNPNSKKKHKNGAKNGIMTTDVRLSAALRYFAGGRPEDTSLAHGTSHTEVFVSVWRVVDAVNACADLAFSYPSDWEEQHEIARGFQAKSKAGFDCCAGATDGMLLWIEKPNERECNLAKCGSGKFLCGRKGKFGLNLQGTCDSRGRFLDVSVCHPGSTSDHLAFTASPLHCKLEEKGFLAPGLCIFGDLACVNTPCMATPFKSVKSGPKDAYNFYHSSPRINIECAFGMLVSRFGFLRKATPATIGLRKTTAAVVCLCRLHNYCIDRRIAIEKLTAKDNVEVSSKGGIPLVRRSDNQHSPDQLLNGGHHFEDISVTHRQQPAREARAALGEGERLPRDKMLDIVISEGPQRPVPKGWQ